MKKLFLGLMMTLSAVAFAGKESVIFPHVYNYGSSVQVQVWNTTNRMVTCSGWINMTLQSGKRDQAHYFEMLSPGFNSFRTFYTRDFNDRVMSVYHTIFCN